ncbi:MAG: Fic family protein [Bdellovibrionales bacterium]
MIIGKEKNTQIHPQVARKLEDYGYRWARQTVKKKNKDVDVIALDFGTQARVSRNLDQFLQDLNRRIQDHLQLGQGRVEDLVTFAVQELLIVHPFVDGNGRTARLLGQVLHEVLTRETVIFPREFFEEMSWSHQELTEKLAEQKRKSRMEYLLDRVLQNADPEFASFLEETSLSQWDVLTVSTLKAANPRSVGDTVFGEVLMEDRDGRVRKMGGRESSGFLLGRTPPLFFGASTASYVELMGRVRKLFENGRDLREFPTSRSLNNHVASKVIRSIKQGLYDEKPSAFVQTSLSHRTAKHFATWVSSGPKRKFGFVLVIDSRGAELLSVDKSEIRTVEEQEVLFDSTLDPRRIYGAYLLWEGRPVGFVLNPNYNSNWIQGQLLK